jgi:NAD-dependent deacetylase
LSDAAGEPPPSPYVRDGYARPDVVWFGETLPQAAFEQAVQIAGNCAFCFSVGTTSLVQPAAGLPLLAARNGAALVEINPRETPLSAQSDQCIRAPASQALAAIAAQVGAARGMD